MSLNPGVSGVTAPFMRPTLLFLLMFSALLPGCAGLVSGAVGGFTDGLGAAVLDMDDPETVRDGVPTLILVVEGLRESAPDDPVLLDAAATLYSAYAGQFVTEPVRQQRMVTRALDYAVRAACLRDEDACGIRTRPFDAFTTWVESRQSDDVPGLFALGGIWAGWIQASASDWNAVAELARVRLIMERIVDLDETHEYGQAHLYLAVFDTLVPPALGGRPEAGRAHFERALAISDRRFLQAQVYYARQYARLVFDQELHDALLNEVLEADPVLPGATLANVLAQAQARRLLDTSAEYFE